MGDNTPRVREGTEHVESWFLRANHPTEPRAIWVKATILCSSAGVAVAEAWCSLFDGERTQAARQTVPLDQASYTPQRIEVAQTSWQLDGAAQGAIGELSWDLRWEPIQGLGEPLCLLPTRRLVDAPLPKNKLLTPVPAARFSGRVGWGDQSWELDGWPGMQGHNWGAAHAPEYAWGHCLFMDAQGEPFAVVEGASGRIKLGPVLSPLLSLLTVRRAGREYRFDRLVDTWRQRPVIDFPRWELSMRGSDGEAALVMCGQPDRMVCLGYDQPDGQRAFCLNSKTAQVTLRVNPTDGPAFECTSSHGGALEFLQPVEHPAVQPVV